MEQRRVRLGDIVDDYCPRERRVTNHAVVAMIEDEIRQTRCTVCDAEHPYKAARVPRARKKTGPAAPSAAVLAARGDSEAEPPNPGAIHAEGESTAEPMYAAGPDEARRPVEEPAPGAPQPVAAPATGEPSAAGGSGVDGEPLEDGPVRRPLIRATLPRHEGQPTARPAPEFTMRQSGVRGSRLIENGGRGDQRPERPGGNGSRPPQHARHGQRQGPGGGHGRSRGPQHAGSRYDRPRGHGGPGNRPGQSMRGGKKRSR
jgi:hypothetical protein